MTAHDDIEEEKPLDPATERVRRKMVRLLGVSIAVMLIGLMAVLGAIVYKVAYRQNGEGTVVPDAARNGVPVEPGFEGRIDLADGAEILSVDLDAGNVLLRVRWPGKGEQLLIYDLGQDRIIAKVAIE